MTLLPHIPRLDHRHIQNHGQGDDLVALSKVAELCGYLSDVGRSRLLAPRRTGQIGTGSPIPSSGFGVIAISIH